MMIFAKAQRIFNTAFSGEPHQVFGLDKPTDLVKVIEGYSSASNKKNKKLILLSDEEECERFAKSLTQPHVTLKSLTKHPYSDALINSKTQIERMTFLCSALSENTSLLYISHPEALCLKTAPPLELKKHILKFEFADTFFEDPSSELKKLGYSPSQFVEYPGEFSDKGGILDLFPPTYTEPIRIGLFGREIESINSFSPKTQRSTGELDQFTLYPASESVFTDQVFSEFLTYFSKAPLLDDEWKLKTLAKIREKKVFENPEFFISKFWKSPTESLSYFKPETTEVFVFNHQALKSKFKLFTDDLHLTYENLEKKDPKTIVSPLEMYEDRLNLDSYTKMIDFSPVLISDIDDFAGVKETKRNIQYQTQSLDKRLQRLKEDSKSWDHYMQLCLETLNSWLEKHQSLVIFCNGKTTVSSCEAYLNNLNIKFKVLDSLFDATPQNEVFVLNSKLNQSTRYLSENLIFLSYEQLFGKLKEKRSKKSAQKTYFENLDLLQISDLNINDLVVHRHHGVGSYKGLKPLSLNNVLSECIEIQYSGKDKLFLPVHSINQIRKYANSTSTRALDKLGGGSWQKLKTKAQKKLKEIAQELVDLYAQRRLINRTPITVDQKDSLLFEGQFPYQETDDQIKAIEDIQDDLTKSHPMDRLICGDVGFGKTEVAMRAAFNYLNAGYQVAVLAPTTVLSLQHYNSFTERFKSWPFEIRGFNRFISNKKMKESLEELKTGKADLAVGTHRLLSQDVSFKNLGLLVVDEEQKFGVKQKEKIKLIQKNIDIITLSATPIPRTLNMGFLGVRDLSLISTPPKDRLPVKTFVSHYNNQIIKKAIETEVGRGGQVFFVHNRVNSIYALYQDLKDLMPDLRIGLGHGQMSEKELESVMVNFFNKKIDVLLSTTIIESGVDVSSANTMIINNAQNFGLSQLYQLRGRVGRSEKRAYCYLLIPQNRDLEKDQKTKLKVLQDNTELGSGIQIAHHDLELRGAGNLLGESQSGHADEIGHELYLELLEEAIAEVKGEEFIKEVEPEVNIALPALIPASFIKDIKSRLYYYRKINNIRDEADLDSLEDELRDQFGKVPDEVIGLFFLTSIKNHLAELGVQELKAGPKNLSLKLADKNNINTDVLLKLIQKEPKNFRLTPDNRILVAFVIENWKDLYEKILQIKSKLKL